jgi:hypothetical protein
MAAAKDQSFLHDKSHESTQKMIDSTMTPTINAIDVAISTHEVADLEMILE